MSDVRNLQEIRIDEELIIRTADRDDIEYLRLWKNAYRAFFHHKELISREQQKSWFDNYQTREDDYIFIVCYQGAPVGCIGIRFLADHWDIYNVILGDKRCAKKGIMSKSLARIIEYASNVNLAEISLEVLSENLAVDWYAKNGFRKVDSIDGAYIMKYDPYNLKQENT